MQMLTFSQVNNLTSQQYINLLSQTSLGERRPIQNPEQITNMLKHSNLIIVAWFGEELVGIARCVTDFTFCCYLSDLAVSQHYQNLGIGKKLISEVQTHLSKNCTLILLAAPQAEGYYPKIGFEQHHSTWTKKATN